MSNNTSTRIDTAPTAKLPMMLSHLTTCHLSQNYMLDDELFENATFSVDQKINIHVSGIPLYCTRTKSPPTSAISPGHMIQGGYTPSGKYKTARYVPPKLDKRAGQ